MNQETCTSTRLYPLSVMTGMEKVEKITFSEQEKKKLDIFPRLFSYSPSFLLRSFMEKRKLPSIIKVILHMFLYRKKSLK